MQGSPNIVNVAALIADHARAAVLQALMSGVALTATELADLAGVARPTISAHLARLVDAGLLSVAVQGRHRYFRLAGPEVAALLETLMHAAAGMAPRVATGPRDPALRRARVCYDHLAGELGVRVFATLAQQGVFAFGADGLALTPGGQAHFARFGIDARALGRASRPVCRTCLDWSERRDHLAGALGAALLAQVLASGWARREGKSRVLRFSDAGAAQLLQWAGAAASALDAQHAA